LGASPKVFVPLALTSRTDKPPAELLRSSRVFATVGEDLEDRGILLDAPGSGILAAIERSLHVDFSKIAPEDLRSSLNSGLKALGIGNVIDLELGGDTTRVELEFTILLALESRLRSVAPRLSERVGTPIVSTVAAAVSKATGNYVRIESAVLDPTRKRVSMALRQTT